MKVKNASDLNSTFGTPYVKVGKDYKESPEWEAENLVNVDLPFPMRLAWNTDITVSKVRVHKLIAPRVTQALTAVWSKARYMCKQKYGFKETTKFYDTKALELLRSLNLDLYGGAYNFRPKRNSNDISMHAYGLALDIDPSHNVLGSKKTTLPGWYIGCWTSAGFDWGGNWTKRKDPMHFECKKVAEPEEKS